MTTLVELVLSMWFFFTDSILPRFWLIVTSPYYHQAMVWTIVPLLMATTLMIVYFGHWKQEELGWNTAYGNTISLFFVIASLIRELVLRYRYEDFLYVGPPVIKLIFVSLLAFETLILVYFNYFHLLPKSLSFLISGTLPVNGTALLAILLVQGDIPLDYITIWTGAFYFMVFWLVFSLLKLSVKPSKEAKISMAFARKKRIKEHQAQARKIHRFVSKKKKIASLFLKDLNPFLEPEEPDPKMK